VVPRGQDKVASCKGGGSAGEVVGVAVRLDDQGSLVGGKSVLLV